MPAGLRNADGNDHVDLFDFTRFHGCFGSTTAECLNGLDLDTDGDIDSPGFALFQTAFTGRSSVLSA